MKRSPKPGPAGLRTLRTSAGKVGRDRYVLRWISGKPYVYLREHLGAEGHARPKRRDIYLGKLDAELAAHGTPAQLSAAAYRLRRKATAAARSSSAKKKDR